MARGVGIIAHDLDVLGAVGGGQIVGLNIREVVGGVVGYVLIDDSQELG